MTQMYAMERQVEFEGFSTLATVLALLIGGDKPRITAVFKAVETYRQTFSFRPWSLDHKKEKVEKAATDMELLERLNAMSKK